MTKVTKVRRPIIYCATRLEHCSISLQQQLSHRDLEAVCILLQGRPLLTRWDTPLRQVVSFGPC